MPEWLRKNDKEPVHESNVNLGERFVEEADGFVDVGLVVFSMGAMRMVFP